MSDSTLGTQYQIAFIIDVSDSMSGEALQEAKNAYTNLTQLFVEYGIADVSQFAVIPFSSDAYLNAPLDAGQTISTIEGLTAGGFTNINSALTKANQFFASEPSQTHNLVYFLSDGFSTTGGDFTNEAQALKAVADVRAYSFGAANIIELRTIDSNEPEIVPEVSHLATKFAESMADLPKSPQTSSVPVDKPVEDNLSDSVTEDKPVEDNLSDSVTEDKPVEDNLSDSVTEDKPVEDNSSDSVTEDKPVEDNLSDSVTEDKPLEDNSSDTNNNQPLTQEQENLVNDSGEATSQIPPTLGSNSNIDVSKDAALPVLNIQDISVTEGDLGTTIAELVVNLSLPATQEIQFFYETVDGTAVSGSDYNETSGQITIPVGETTVSIDLEINGDSEVEPNENFLVKLTSLSGATFENNEAEYSKVIVVENDDVVQNNDVSENNDIEQNSPIVPQSVAPSTQEADEGNIDDGNIIDGNIINLQSFTGEVTIDFTVTREAEFDNSFSFYEIQDKAGTIIDPITKEILQPGDDKYKEVALQLRIPELELSVDNNLDSIIIQDNLLGGKLYAPIAISDGSFDSLQEDSQVYFSFAPANPDNLEHIQSEANNTNTLGFEDLFGGGDLDFDDLSINVEIA